MARTGWFVDEVACWGMFLGGGTGPCWFAGLGVGIRGVVPVFPSTAWRQVAVCGVGVWGVVWMLRLGGGQLVEVVGDADERPFMTHLIEAAQQELAEAPGLLDLAEDRLDGHLAQAGSGCAGRPVSSAAPWPRAGCPAARLGGSPPPRRHVSGARRRGSRGWRAPPGSRGCARYSSRHRRRVRRAAFRSPPRWPRSWAPTGPDRCPWRSGPWATIT